MTISIRVRLEHQTWPEAVSATGATLASAVQRAAGMLGLAPGRTIAKEPVGARSWRWTWGRRDERHMLHVSQYDRESVSNAYRARQVVSVTLSREQLARLDEMADRRGLDRSKCAGAIIDEAYQK